MAEFTSRGTIKPNYWNMQHGIMEGSGLAQAGVDQLITGSDEMLGFNVDSENMADIDPDLLDNMLLDESMELSQLESQVVQLKQHKEKKKRAILDKLEKLNAVRERKSMLQRVLVGDLPAHAVPLANTTVQQTSTIPATPGILGTARKQSILKQTPRVAFTEGRAANMPQGQPTTSPATLNQPKPNLQGEFSELFNSLLQLQSGNLAPFAHLMGNRNPVVNEESGILHNSSMNDITDVPKRVRKKFEIRK